MLEFPAGGVWRRRGCRRLFFSQQPSASIPWCSSIPTYHLVQPDGLPARQPSWVESRALSPPASTLSSARWMSR